jgi:homotetrameric cytidine deaminase
MSSARDQVVQYSASHPRVIQAIKLAWDLRCNAWAPYSSFAVGAVVYLPQQDELIGGVNIENVSFGATICAERAAVCRAISIYGKVDFGFLVVAAALDPAVSPCGMCLQVLVEFCQPQLPIFLVNSQGLQTTTSLGILMPRAFTDFSGIPRLP